MAKTDTNNQAVSYSKEQLAASEKYANQRDLISVLLVDGKSYTFHEVDALIKKYMKGDVR